MNWRNNNCSVIFIVFKGSKDEIISEFDSCIFNVVVYILSLIKSTKANISPSTFNTKHSNKTACNCSLLSCFLNNSFQLFGNLLWVFIMFGFNVLNVKNIRFILVGIFVDLSFNIFWNFWMSVKSINNELKNYFIVFLLTFFLALIKNINFSACFFYVADMEESSGIWKGLSIFILGIFWTWDQNFIHFNTVFKNRFNYFWNLCFKIFLIKEFFSDLLKFFSWFTLSLELEHHLWKMFSNDSLGYSNLVCQDYRMVKSLLNIGSIIRTIVINKGKSFILLILGQG